MNDLSQINQMLQNLQSQIKMVEAYAAPYVSKLGTPQSGIAPPQESSISPTPEVQQVTEQLSTLNLSGQQELLLKMYDEFAITDDGKALAANLNKFARFVQSKVAKTS